MFKKILLILGFLLFVSPVFAIEPTKLKWDANSPEDAVLGYKLYTSQEEGVYPEIPTKIITEGTSTEVVLAAGTWYLVLTAYNTLGQSDYSNIVLTESGIPSKPTGFKKVTITIVIE